MIVPPAVLPIVVFEVPEPFMLVAPVRVRPSAAVTSPANADVMPLRLMVSPLAFVVPILIVPL